MERFEIDCDLCEAVNYAVLEGEDCGDGTEHILDCSGCNAEIRFEITYSPNAWVLNCSERASSDTAGGGDE